MVAAFSLGSSLKTLAAFLLDMNRLRGRIGASGKGISLLGRFAPRLADKIMEKTMIKQQQSVPPAGPSEENRLYRSSGDLKERGGYAGHVAESSL